MPSKHRVSVTISARLDRDLDRLARATGRSRASIVREWLELASPAIGGIADIAEAAKTATREERDAIVKLLDTVADSLALALSSVPVARAAAAPQSARASGSAGEPPTSNTGVPNGGGKYHS